MLHILGKLESKSALVGRVGIVLALALAFTHCASSQSGSVADALVGDWEAVAAQIVLRTEDQSGRTRVIDVPEGTWEQRMNRTAPQMTYRENHAYTSAYISLIDVEGRAVRDSVKQAGTWDLRNDTLIIKEPNLSVPTSFFKLKIAGDSLELTATMDIDGDGFADDDYWMKQRRR